MQRLFIAVALGACIVAVDAEAADKLGFSYCPYKHVMGHGQAQLLPEAIVKATADCIQRGGIPGCCQKFVGEDKSAKRKSVMGDADRFAAAHP